MKLVTFSHGSRVQLGELDGDRVYSISGPDTMRMMDVIRRGITPNRIGNYYSLDEVQLHAPLVPGKIIAIGRNYAEHAQETGSDLPSAPIIFAKLPSAVIGPGETITWRESVTKEVDWEVELGVIIGRRARDVSEEDALNYVYGYTVANDVSARDLQLRIDDQWTRGKSLDTFCPLGPTIVLRSAIDDPNDLDLWTTINGEKVQDSNTKHMIFNVPYLIAYSSQMFTLEPGDMILTGTPSGVGEGMNPKRYLKDGDEVTVGVAGIGELTNPVKVTE